MIESGQIIPQWVRVLASFLTLALVVFMIDWTKLIAGARVDRAMLLLTLILAFVQVPLASRRWQCLLRGFGIRISMRQLLPIYTGSSLLNAIVLPMSGVVARIATLTRGGHDSRGVIASVVLEQALTVGMLALAAALGLAYSTVALDILDSRYGHLALALSVVGAIIGSLVVLARGGIGTLLETLVEPLRLIAAPREPRALRSGVILSLVTLVLTIMIYYAATATTSGVAVPIVTFVAVVPWVILLASLPISVGGWGVREGGLIVALMPLGVEPEAALLASLIVGGAALLATALLSVVASFLRTD
jgi:uncharacterized membrane protein YbhN (UPF0104 family)